MIKKAMSSLLIAFMLAGAFAPVANCEIKALALSLEIVNNMPAVLEAVTMEQLNSIVLSGMFKDNDFDKTSKSSDKKGNVNTNIDCTFVKASISNFKQVVTRVSSDALNASTAVSALELLNIEDSRNGPSGSSMQITHVLQCLTATTMARGDTAVVLYINGAIAV